MPLSSVEEWRARIGSSWCALGRPIQSVGHRVSGEALLRFFSMLTIILLTLVALVVNMQTIWKVENVFGRSISAGYGGLRSKFHRQSILLNLNFSA